MKILLVDDDAFLRDMYATKFIEVGDQVASAENATDALEQLSEKEFDVVLLDMVMPGMNGIELIKAIKSHDKANKTMCIVLSNQGEDSDIQLATKAGATGYIIKADMIPSEVVSKVHSYVTA